MNIIIFCECSMPLLHQMTHNFINIHNGKNLWLICDVRSSSKKNLWRQNGEIWAEIFARQVFFLVSILYFWRHILEVLHKKNKIRRGNHDESLLWLPFYSGKMPSSFFFSFSSDLFFFLFCGNSLHHIRYPTAWESGANSGAAQDCYRK